MSTVAPTPPTLPVWRNRRRLFGVGAALVAALLTVGAVLVYRAVKHEARFDKPDLLYDYMVFGPSSEAQALKRRDAFVEEAKKIRAGLEPWAREHKDLLARMRRAPKGDAAIFEEVFSAVPRRSPHPVGFRSISDLEDRTKTIFSYNARRGSGDNAKGAAERRVAEEGRMRDMFDRYQDIPIAISVNSGRKSVIMWVTGRITESTFNVEASQGAKSRSFYIEPVELVPTYDFLR